MAQERRTRVLSTKISEELEDQIELLADADGITKAEWARNELARAVNERDLSESDMLSAVLERQGDDIEVRETEDGGIEAYLPGGSRDPLPLGAIRRISDE